MSIYHITYTSEKQHLYLFTDNGCNFSCHGCITDKNPTDYHLKNANHTLGSELNEEAEVMEKISDLDIKKVTWLGKEPTCDPLFHNLIKSFKKQFNSYNILITNSYEDCPDSLDWLDEVCVSIKAVTPVIFKSFTGKDNPDIVLNNLSGIFKKEHIKLRTESVMVPGLIDSTEIAIIASNISKISDDIPYRIDGYIPFGENDIYSKPNQAEMIEAKYKAGVFLNEVSILHSNTKPSQSLKVIH